LAARVEVLFVVPVPHSTSTRLLSLPADIQNSPAPAMTAVAAT
jgi:hypothetical protein